MPAADAFTVKVGGSSVDLAATDRSPSAGSVETLTLAEAVLQGQMVTVGYTAPASGSKLQDADNAKKPVTGFLGPVGHQQHVVGQRVAASGGESGRRQRQHPFGNLNIIVSNSCAH